MVLMSDVPRDITRGERLPAVPDGLLLPEKGPLHSMIWAVFTENRTDGRRRKPLCRCPLFAGAARLLVFGDHLMDRHSRHAQVVAHSLQRTDQLLSYPLR